MVVDRCDSGENCQLHICDFYLVGLTALAQSFLKRGAALRTLKNDCVPYCKGKLPNFDIVFLLADQKEHLRGTLSLLERVSYETRATHHINMDQLVEWFLLQVLMKDIVTPVAATQVRQIIKECLDQAALVNYTRISEYALIEGTRKLLLCSNSFLF